MTSFTFLRKIKLPFANSVLKLGNKLINENQKKDWPKALNRCSVDASQSYLLNTSNTLEKNPTSLKFVIYFGLWFCVWSFRKLKPEMDIWRLKMPRPWCCTIFHCFLQHSQLHKGMLHDDQTTSCNWRLFWSLVTITIIEKKIYYRRQSSHGNLLFFLFHMEKNLSFNLFSSIILLFLLSFTMTRILFILDNV